MDPKKLIERLNCPNIYCCPLEPGETTCSKCQKSVNKEAAAALTALTEENAQLRAELEQVKRERDAYEFCGKDLLSRGNCNDCGGKENCAYRPRPGETVRANCPLWRGPQKEE